MTDGTSIDKDDDVILGFLDQTDDLVDDELLGIRVVGGRKAGEGGVEALRRDLLVDQVGGEGHVDGACLGDTLGEKTIDLGGGVGNAHDAGLGNGELLRSFVVRVISKQGDKIR